MIHLERLSQLIDYGYFKTSLQLDPFQVLLQAYKHYERLSAGNPSYPSKAHIFKETALQMWGPHNKVRQFIWHPWADRMNEVCHSYQYAALNGAASCVSGDTRLLDPITGRHIAIGDLCATGRRPTVMTRFGPIVAGVPFLKGQAELFRVSLSNGTQFDATAEHRVSVEGAFCHVSSLRLGQRLDGYDEDRLLSTLGSAHSIRALDVRRWRRIVAGSPGDCLPCCHSHDGQPHRVSGNGQLTVPLPSDALLHNECAFGHTDVLGIESSHIHRDRCAARLSIANYEDLFDLQETKGDSCQSVSKNDAPSRQSFRLLAQFRPNKPHLQPLQSPFGGYACTPTFCEDGASSCQDCMVAPTVVSIESLGIRDFFDLHVPIANHYFAEGAIHHNSGKTDFASIFGIINWLCDPENTLVLVTTTGIADAQRRIWGSLEKYWSSAPAMPGHLVRSLHQISTVSARGEKLHGQAGIVLIAGEKKKEKEALGKLIGAKSKRVILIADELPELSEAILETALGNLTSNPYFQMVGIGNFKSRYDPFGTFCRPKAGYDSISVDSDSWETELGWCERFDGMRSPNITEGRSGKDLYPIYGPKQLEGHKRDLGETSASFWRMCRSFEPRIGLDNAIYSESDLIAGRSYSSCIWQGEPVMVSSLDPSFTNGGDRSVQWIGKWGMTVDGVNMLLLHKMLLLRENVNLKDKTRNYQIAEQFIANCKEHGVQPRHAGLDSTAAGGVFADIVCELWDYNILRVDFSGGASEMQVMASSAKTGDKTYDRKVSELWYAGLEFVKSKQIRGVTPELARELKARIYDTVKGAEGLKIRVETKKDMKDRLSFSPDIADSFAVLLHLCRERLGFLAGGNSSGFAAAAQDWREQVKQAQAMYEESSMYQPEAFANTL